MVKLSKFILNHEKINKIYPSKSSGMSIEKQYFFRTLLFLGCIIVFGLLVMSVISDTIKQIELKTIEKTIQNIIQNKIEKNLTLADFEPGDEPQHNLSILLDDVKSNYFLGASVWNKEGILLYSTTAEQPDNIFDTKIFKQTLSGQTTAAIKERYLDTSKSLRLNDELEIFMGLYLRDNVVGVVKWNMDPSSILYHAKDAQNFLLVVMLIAVATVSSIVISDYWFSRKKLLRELRESQDQITSTKIDLQQTRKALNNSSIMSITDHNGNYTYVNENFEETYGYRIQDLLGKNHHIIDSGFHPPEFFEKMERAVSHGFIWEGEIKNKAKDGRLIWTHATVVPLLGLNKTGNTFVTLRFDISKQKQIEEDLAKMNERLRGDDKLKEEFASMVSHELKSPLTPITGYCEMLLDPNLFGSLTPEQFESINVIKNNAKRLENLISDVLDAQKLALNQMTLVQRSFDIRKFLDAARDDLLFLMLPKNIKFEIYLDFDGMIVSDETRLRQVLDNLVRNSVDFVPENGGEIFIGVEKKPEEFLFYVKDNGMGISLENQEKLFRKFYQIDTSMTRKHGGTGLGLVVCKGIIENLGGKISVESELGKGAKFYFTIPKTIIQPISLPE